MTDTCIGGFSKIYKPLNHFKSLKTRHIHDQRLTKKFVLQFKKEPHVI